MGWGGVWHTAWETAGVQQLPPSLLGPLAPRCLQAKPWLPAHLHTQGHSLADGGGGERQRAGARHRQQEARAGRDCTMRAGGAGARAGRAGPCGRVLGRAALSCLQQAPCRAHPHSPTQLSRLIPPHPTATSSPRRRAAWKVSSCTAWWEFRGRKRKVRLRQPVQGAGAEWLTCGAAVHPAAGWRPLAHSKQRAPSYPGLGVFTHTPLARPHLT